MRKSDGASLKHRSFFKLFIDSTASDGTPVAFETVNCICNALV